MSYFTTVSGVRPGREDQSAAFENRRGQINSASQGSPAIKAFAPPLRLPQTLLQPSVHATICYTTVPSPCSLLLLSPFLHPTAMQSLHFSCSFPCHQVFADPFEDDFFDQAPLDNIFNIPLPEADQAVLLPDTSSDSSLATSLFQDLFAFDQNDLFCVAPAMLTSTKVMEDDVKLGWPLEHKNHSAMPAQTPAESKNRSSQTTSRRPQPPVVRVQSRQTDFQSGKPVEITFELLAEHFHESLEVAAAKIGIGKSTMKLVCRQLGVEKWPYKFNRKSGRKSLRRPELRTDVHSQREESSTDTDGSEEHMYL
eukprot:767292-Hanusia_phi.AAC.4